MAIQRLEVGDVAGPHPRAGIVTLPKTAFPTDFMGHKEALGSRARQRFLRRAASGQHCWRGY
jgi:hypothetical protein